MGHSQLNQEISEFIVQKRESEIMKREVRVWIDIMVTRQCYIKTFKSKNSLVNKIKYKDNRHLHYDKE